MDWNLFWLAVGGIAAALTFLLTLFLEWPRLRERWAERSTARITLQISILLVGAVGLFLFVASLVLANQILLLTNEAIGKMGFLLMLISVVLMTLHATWMTVTDRIWDLYALLAMAGLFLLAIVVTWSFFICIGANRTNGQQQVEAQASGIFVKQRLGEV